MEQVLKQIEEKNKKLRENGFSTVVLSSERKPVVKGSNRYKERV